MGNLRRVSWTVMAFLLVAATAGCGTRVKQDAAPAASAATTSPPAGSTQPIAAAAGASPADGSAAATVGASPANGPVAPSAGDTGRSRPAAGADASAAAGARSTSGAPKAAAASGAADKQGKAGANPGSAAGAGSTAGPATGSNPGAPVPPTGCPAPCAPLVIGSVGTWSGLVGQNVMGGLNALQAWVAATNAAGGLGGHQVRLVTADDGTDPSRHRALVQELVERRGVAAFVYNAAVFSGHASVSYLEQKRIPVVGGSGTEPWYTTSPMFFTQIIAGEVAIEATVASYARSAKAMGLAKMGLITCSDGVAVCDDTARVAPGYIKRYGLQLAYQGKASLAQPDFTANCLAARNEGAEILYLALDAHSYARFGKGCASVGYKPRYGIAQPVMLAELATDPNLQGSPG